jgi:hypothetical protein
MDNLRTLKQRIINKILLNKVSEKTSKYKQVKIDYVTLQINYRKKKKEIYQVYELISLIEQLSGEKALLKLNESVEKNNIIKLEDGRISVRLRKKKANYFLNNFIYIALGQRSNFTIREKNNIDIQKYLINFRYKNLKLFRNYLVRNYMNLEAKIKIDIKYKAIGEKQNALTNYKFFIGKKNEFRIN